MSIWQQSVKQTVRSAFNALGLDVVRLRRAPLVAPEPPLDTEAVPVEAPRPADYVWVPRYLCPNGHKLYDFREEPGFAAIARETLTQGRTTLEHDRLLVLWQAVRNARDLGRAVAEVG